MAKEVIAHIKLQIPAGQANPAPPVGTALGPRGVNIMSFCKEFNAATQKQAGDILPVVITVFKDKSFTFITKSPPAAVLLKKAANIAAGSKEPNKTKVGKVTRKQVMDIVNTKRKDLKREKGQTWKSGILIWREKLWVDEYFANDSLEIEKIPIGVFEALLQTIEHRGLGISTVDLKRLYPGGMTKEEVLCQLRFMYR